LLDEIERTDRKRGNLAEKRGISDEQVCVICSFVRIGNFLSEAKGEIRPNQTEIERFYEGRIAENPILCTHEISIYKVFARKETIQNKKIRMRTHTPGICHIQFVIRSIDT